MLTQENTDLLQRLARTAERLTYSANWQPPYAGDSEMRIARDGRWFYQGGEITRLALVQLFSRLLRREGEQYFLVTPVEKLSIEVEDAPFVSVDVNVIEQAGQQQVYVTTNLGDTVLISPEHPLQVEVDPESQEPSPYLTIGGNLKVLVQRNDFYRLVDCGEERQLDGQSVFGICSQGDFYLLGVL